MMNRIQFVPCTIVLVGLLSAFSAPAFGQAMPAAEASPISTGFSLPLTAGTLQYGVSASQGFVFGYYGNNSSAKSASLTGDVAYISPSKHDPFSMVFSGGRSWTESSQPSTSFANMALSQVLVFGKWSAVISDGVSYLPETPTTGLSGVPGVGDLGVNPVQVGDTAGQGVLTNNSARIGNSVSGSVQRPITGKTSLNAAGSYSLIQFLGDSGDPANQGLNSNSETGSGGVSHRISVRNTFGGNFSYSKFSFAGNSLGLSTPSFASQSAAAQYSHQFTRKFGMSVSAGPQWTQIASTGVSSLNIYANASGAYSSRFGQLSVSYVRGTNSGSGVVGGAISDSVSVSASRKFDRVWFGALNSSFSRTSSLATPGVSSSDFHTAVFGGQVSRALARSLSGYASYTLEHQSILTAAAAVDAYTGVVQVLGFGLTYSPASVRYGRQ